jgi:hypothetical protein
MDLAKMRFKPGKYMGLAAAVAAFCFLFNPDVAIVDVFPDVFGYILLTLSLRYMRDLSPHFENAWKKFRILAVVSGLELASLLWVFGELSSAQERPTMMLLLSFCFSVVELIWGIPAWRSLTEGFIIHAQTSGGEHPLRENRFGRNITTTFRGATVSFMIAKAFFSNIAEFAVLSTHSYDDTAFDWYEFIGLFRVFALFFGIIVGVVWLVRAQVFFAGILRDTELIESAKAKYENTVMTNEGLRRRRDISLTLGLVALAALAAPDFYIDNVNVIPDALSAILLALAFVKLKPYYKNYIVGLVSSAVYFVMTVWGQAASYSFISDSWVEKTWEDPEVFAEFMAMYPIRIAEAALMVVAFFFALSGVRAIIKGYCGYIPETMEESYRVSRLAAIHKEVGAKVTLTFCVLIVAAACSVLYELMLSLDLFISEIWWVTGFISSIGLFASSLYMMSAVNEEVESRYMLD